MIAMHTYKYSGRHSYKCIACNGVWRISSRVDRSTCPHCGVSADVDNLQSLNPNAIHVLAAARNTLAKRIADGLIDGVVNGALLDEYAEAKRAHIEGIAKHKATEVAEEKENESV